MKMKTLAKGLGKAVDKTMFKKIDDVVSAPISERLIQRKLTPAGMAVLTAGTGIGLGAQAIVNSDGLGRVSKLGYTTKADNLDRLLSYDTSGALQSMKAMANGDDEVLGDIVKNTFDNANQFTARGDLVFALHNIREG